MKEKSPAEEDNIIRLDRLSSEEIAAPIDRLRRLLLPNASLRSLKLDCMRLNESSIDCLLQPGLLELSLRNCYRFSGKLLAEAGARCKDLRLFATSLRYDIVFVQIV
ncbi:hypothetical protein OSB04_021751 [Centaurea solstitialis]|uniref:F-box/LRR-repeat protein 15-like leucin rich repeat domain-containing protein n=1 Tax=Centaurea solstitialis TaxID=347529 RepID=A0AA38SV27_9ASTR|nr:hypothetical protein OSB04_021751 [Centaurea solstitialis]